MTAERTTERTPARTCAPRAAASRVLGLVLVVLLLFAAPPRIARPQDDAPQSIPVAVDVSVDATELATTGLFTIRADFTVEEDVGRAFSVLVQVWAGDRRLLSWEHVPTPPTSKWRKGQKVRSEFLAPFPREAADDGFPSLEVLLAFQDAATRTVVPPHGVFSERGRMAVVAQIEPPTFEAVTDETHVARILAAADELAKAGRRPDAWAALEFGLRGAESDTIKYRLRNAMAKLGDFAPRPLTEVERQIVDARIEDERRRYLRQMSGRLFDQKKYHAALRILEAIGGKLQEAADAAVVGALADAKRAEQDIHDLRERIWEDVSKEEKEEAEKALETLGRTRQCYEKARAWMKEGRSALARRVLKDLAVTAPGDVASAAKDDVRALDQSMLASIPADQQSAADAALRHPAFARTSVSLSHQFVFIGPKTLVDGIPPGSRTAFDLAYVFLTDLFGRRPNPEGDRVTVYFKELWDFGGGVGGGKIIDIGNAKADTTGVGVDNGLLFHELTHCIDDTAPIHAGFREGLADFGAAYAHEALSRPQDAARAFAAAATTFRKDYVERDLEYWRIPNYGVSAGFLLHFSERHAKGPNGHDWRPWRQFFREYRAAPVRDGREPYLIRVFAHYLVRAFGKGAFDDLVAFRFPLVPGDLDAVAKEVESFAGGDAPAPERAAEWHGKEFTNSPIPRDLAQRRAIEAMRIGGLDDEVRRIAKDDLGIVFDWRVVGPFEGEGADPGARQFPPEREIDFAQEYPQRMNVAKWRNVSEPGPVRIDPLGWVLIEYGYMDETATYGLSHVAVDADTDAFVHVRADDDLTLFVNDERIGAFVNRGWNDSTQFWWRGPIEHAPDAMRFPVKLRRGRNKILLKIRNRGGPAGFVLAVSGTDGRAIPGLRADAAPPDASKPAAAPKWRTAAKLDFRAKAALQKLEIAAGGFDVANKLLAGTSSAKGVAWRKYTVRPGFPKDSPSNLAWLKPNLTDGIDSFRLTIALAPRKDAAPKIAVTFQGEGGNDGLSGLNVLLGNSGGKCSGQLERYEELTYDWPAQDVRAKDGKSARDEKNGKDAKDGKDARDGKDDDVLVVTWVARRVTVTLNGATLLDDAPVRPIPGRTRIGFATWGAEPKIASIELETGK